MNDDRFINGNKFDKKYFDELLERIKTIRASERMSYQKITDLFIETSIDYNSKSEEAYKFFKKVQNKRYLNEQELLTFKAVLGILYSVFERKDKMKQEYTNLKLLLKDIRELIALYNDLNPNENLLLTRQKKDYYENDPTAIKPDGIFSAEDAAFANKLLRHDVKKEVGATTSIERPTFAENYKDSHIIDDSKKFTLFKKK